MLSTGLVLPLLLSAMSAESHYPAAVEVFHCPLDESCDKNFDGWPDGWTRGHGPGLPHYVRIKISQQPAPAGDRCLRIDLDGGGAALYSPPVKVTPLLSYVLEGYLKTEGLRYDRAYFSITLLDQDRHRLETFTSDKVQTTQGWLRLRLGPFCCHHDAARLAVIGLHVEPQSREDVRGAVLCRDIWLGRLPRMTLSTNRPHNFFIDPAKVEITCNLSGFVKDSEDDPEVRFQLEDALGRPLGQLRQPLSATATWQPPIDAPGFYRVRAALVQGEATVHEQQLNLVVVEPRQANAGGEFGWSLPQGPRPLPLPVLGELLGQAGVTWVKYPLWFDESAKRAEVDELIAFVEQLRDRDIEPVGLLCTPPPSLQASCDQSQPPAAADIFTPKPQVWYPSLELVLARLAIQVRWWQLGHDQDTSFVGYPNLAAKIAEVKTALDRIGKDFSVGVPWDWRIPLPRASQQDKGSPPWRFLALSADPPLSAEELASQLEASKDTAVRRWVVLEPLPRDAGPLEARTADLVERMVTAKIHGADGIFCPDPFSTDHGLLGDDGTPGELFLPWRTTALLLGGAAYLGSLDLPGASPNHVFARGSDLVMVVCADKPTQEVLYLGETLRQIDPWGRSMVPEQAENRQVIRVERLPTFVTGLSEPITRWSLDLRLARDRLPSTFGRPHENSVRFKNHFPAPVAGEVTLLVPETWKATPKQIPFRLAPGEELQQPFVLTLPYNAPSGRQQIRLDFAIRGPQPCRFSVYRYIEVGLGDVSIEIASRINDEGELEVTQRLINKTDARASFRCALYVPDRRRLATQVVNLGRGRDERVYRLPDGKELLGKTLWLRAEEVGGPRTLNYRFVAGK